MSELKDVYMTRIRRNESVSGKCSTRTLATFLVDVNDLVSIVTLQSKEPFTTMFDGRLYREVKGAAGRCGVDVEVVGVESAEAVREHVCDKYANGQDSWLWEHFDECATMSMAV